MWISASALIEALKKVDKAQAAFVAYRAEQAGQADESLNLEGTEAALEEIRAALYEILASADAAPKKDEREPQRTYRLAGQGALK